MHALLIVIFIQTDANLNQLLKIAYLIKFSKNMMKNYFLMRKFLKTTDTF